MAKLTRRPGVAVLTAGPGVTNGMSAMTTAHFNGSPLVVLGGRAPQAPVGRGFAAGVRPRPGRGADHQGRRAPSPAPNDTAEEIQHAVLTALTPHRGPVFVDFPLDVVFVRRRRPAANGGVPKGSDPDPDDVARRRGTASPGPSAPRSSRAATSTGTARGRRSRAAPRRCGCRCSSTASAGAACPPTTSWRSAALGGC